MAVLRNNELKAPLGAHSMRRDAAASRGTIGRGDPLTINQGLDGKAHP